MLQNQLLRQIPAVDRLLTNSDIKQLMAATNEDLVKHAIRNVIDEARQKALECGEVMTLDEILQKVRAHVNYIFQPSLRSVINGSGIVLHTNLGRAPLGIELLEEVKEVLSGYNNLEFNLNNGSRGERNGHLAPIVRYLTGAEDVIVVNNNAAAVLFLLTAFGKRKESIVSRGELIEIGGSFRIPDIMKISGSKMVEVGATNKTKISDYEHAITDKTAILFKAHRSNFVIKGFTEEVSMKELADLGQKHNLLSIYDIGSGLLRKVDNEALREEPDVREAIASGVDLVCFSGDKLLGGGQAGIIAGKKKYIDLLKKHPLLRALRVCKTTIAILEKACSYYLDDEKLFKNNILFSTLHRSAEEIEQSAQFLKEELAKLGVMSTVSPSEGQYGGGTLPDLTLPSYQVKLELEKKQSGKALYHQLLLSDMPLLANLRSGHIYIDLLCIRNSDIPSIAKSIWNTLS